MYVCAYVSVCVCVFQITGEREESGRHLKKSSKQVPNSKDHGHTSLGSERETTSG